MPDCLTNQTSKQVKSHLNCLGAKVIWPKRSQWGIANLIVPLVYAMSFPSSLPRVLITEFVEPSTENGANCRCKNGTHTSAARFLAFRRNNETSSIFAEVELGVSKNRGTPKSSILIGFGTIINHPFWGFSPYFWKHPIGYQSLER